MKRTVLGLTGGRQGGQRAPMERVGGGDHLVGSTPLLLAILAGQFEGSFIGLGAAVPIRGRLRAPST